MTDTLTALLLQLSEAGGPALLWGRAAKPYLGRTFDRLLAAGVLTELVAAEDWSTCADCQCDFDARPIRRIGGRILAVCPIDAGSDTLLEEDDLRDFRIDPERLVGLIAEASGFEEPVEPLTPGLWRLSRLPSRRLVVVSLTCQMLVQPGIVLMLKAAANGTPVTVLAPDPGQAIRLRFLEAGIDLVELRTGLKPGPRGIDVLDLAMLEAECAAPRLKIERRARRATLDGRSVHMSEQVFALLMFLTERALESPATVEIRAIEDHIWGAGIHRISSSIREPIRALRATLASAVKDKAVVQGLIEYRRNPNGYRLAMDARDIAISE